MRACVWLWLAAVVCTARAQPLRWIGAEGEWEDEARWSPRAPTGFEDVLIEGAGSDAQLTQDFVFQRDARVAVNDGGQLTVRSEAELVLVDEVSVSIRDGLLALWTGARCIARDSAHVGVSGGGGVDLRGLLSVMELEAQEESFVEVAEGGSLWVDGALSLSGTAAISVSDTSFLIFGADNAPQIFVEDVEELRGDVEGESAEDEGEEVDDEAEDQKRGLVAGDASTGAEIRLMGQSALSMSGKSKLVLFSGSLLMDGQHRASMASGTDIELFSGEFAMRGSATLDLSEGASVEVVEGNATFAGSSVVVGVVAEVEVTGGAVTLEAAAAWKLSGSEIAVNGGTFAVRDAASATFSGPRAGTSDQFFAEQPPEESGFMRVDVIDGVVTVIDDARWALDSGSYMHVVGQMRVGGAALLHVRHAQLVVFERFVCAEELERFQCDCSCPLAGDASVQCELGENQELCDEQCELQACPDLQVLLEDDEIVCGDCTGECVGSCEADGGYVRESGEVLLDDVSRTLVDRGQVVVEAGAVVARGTAVLETFSSHFRVSAGHVALEESASARFVLASNLTVDGELTVSDGASLTLDASSLYLSQTLQLDGSARMSMLGGSVAVVSEGDLELRDSARLELSGGSRLVVERGTVMLGEGTRIALESGSEIVNAFQMSLIGSSATCGGDDAFTVTEGGVLKFSDSLSFTPQSAGNACELVSRGTVDLCESTEVEFGVGVVNAGYMRVCGGSKRFANLSSAVGGTLDLLRTDMELDSPLDNAGTLTGQFTARGRVTNRGLISHPSDRAMEQGVLVSQFEVDEFENARSGTIAIAVESLNDTARISHIAVGQSAFLDGQMLICLSSDVDDEVEDSTRIEVMTYGTRRGTFADVQFSCRADAHGRARSVRAASRLEQCASLEYGAANLAVVFSGCGGNSRPFYKSVYLWLSVSLFVVVLLVSVAVVLAYGFSARFRKQFNGRNRNQQRLVKLRAERRSSLYDVESEGGVSI